MRVRGMLTALAVSAVLYATGPAAEAASKPKPTPTSTIKTLTGRTACSSGTRKLCLRVEKKQAPAKNKRLVTYLTLAATAGRLPSGWSVVFAGQTQAGKDVRVLSCPKGVGSCASYFPAPEKYTWVAAQLVGGRGKILAQTPQIHLPLP